MRTNEPVLTFYSVDARCSRKVRGLHLLPKPGDTRSELYRFETRLVRTDRLVHYDLEGDILMGSVSRVVGNQAAPAEKNGDMGATVDFPRTLQLELAYQVATDGKVSNVHDY